MSLPEQLYLAMAMTAFTAFFVVLMTTWIVTRGWAPREAPAVAAPSGDKAHSEPRRLAA